MIQLFRVLLPSWKFFDGVGEAPELFYRMISPEGSVDQWRLCIPKTGRRRLKNLWNNSRENFLFASHALLEYLKNDLQGDEDASVSLELVKNLVEFQIKDSGLTATRFQFLLGSTPSEENADYVSPILEVSP